MNRPVCLYLCNEYLDGMAPVRHQHLKLRSLFNLYSLNRVRFGSEEPVCKQRGSALNPRTRKTRLHYLIHAADTVILRSRVQARNFNLRAQFSPIER